MKNLQLWLKYGLSYGLLMILFSLFTTYVYYMGFWTQSLISFVVLFIFFYLIAKKYKEANEGLLSYGETFKYLFLMSVVGFAVLILYSYVFFNLIDPNAAEVIYQKTLDGLTSTYKSMGMSEDQIVLAMEAAEEQKGNQYSIGNLLIGFFSNMIFVLILSALGALFLKKENKQQSY